MTRPVKYKIPFDELGHVYGSVSSIMGGYVEWKDNYVFKDTIRYSEYYKVGCSLVFYFISLDSSEKFYPMFISDFHNLLKNKGLYTTMINDKVALCHTGEFTFRKKGRSYGIYAL